MGPLELGGSRPDRSRIDPIAPDLAGAVHDFTHRLTAIAATAARLVGELGEQPAPHRLAVRIRDAAERASGLARQLLAGARPPRREPFDLHDVVAAACGLLACTLQPAIELRLRLAAELPICLGDAARLQHALLDLGLNARDAMPEGGTLSIATASVTLDASACARLGLDLEPGDYVELTVSDDGVGMDEAVLRRAFEPFFTTKRLGRGTGLGLAAVHRAVIEQRGAIRVDSQLGRGTTFRICLPVVAPGAPAAPAAPTAR